MDDLFEQLKAEPPVNKYVRDAPDVQKATSEITSNTCLSPRRESMPPPASVVVIQKSNKSRSLSPPKALDASSIKNFKVMIQRKNLSNIVATKPTNSEFIPPKPKEPERKRKMSTSVKDEKTVTSEEKTPSQSPIKKSRLTPAKVDETASVVTKPESIKKMTPTKAQQKLFEPAVPVKVAVAAKPLKQFKVKRCTVRVRQDNLEKLQREHVNHKGKRGRPQKSKVAPKRKMPSGSSSEHDSPPAKKQRSPQTEKNKPTAGFFIKLTTSPSTAYGSKKNHNKKSPPKADKSSHKSSASSPTTLSKNHHKKSSTKDKSATKKHTSHTPKSTTKPTKFTRTQLIKAFGKRFFRSRVKIERCKHPMMLTFESNARARRLQTKRNKSKNLSVSFREQVEIFGDYDSESEADNESEADASMNDSATAAATSSSNKAAPGAMQKSLPFPSNPMPVMPARLKKVENGKLIDDIELDPSLFIDPACAVSSTPFASPGRKKREKKSYSVLKGDGTPSPRKEQLKLANEKLPPSGLRRLNIDMDDDDDEDDDCEYIVPIEIPQRRMSRANSGVDVPEVESSITEKLPQQVNKEVEDIPPTNLAADSSNSFTSALSDAAAAPPLTADVEGDATDERHMDETNKATPVQDENEEAEVNAATTNNISTRLTSQTDSPAPLLSTLTDLVDAAINNGDEMLETNEDDDNLDDIVSNKLGNELDGADLPLNLFVEDSGQNSEFLDDSAVQKSTISDSIVNETINKTIDNLSKDIEMAETNALTKLPPSALKPTSAAISKTARASE